MNLLIMVAVFSDEYSHHADVIQQTWDATPVAGVRVVYVWSDKHDSFDGRNLRLKCGDAVISRHVTFPGWVDTFRPILNYACQNMEFSHILLTNVSSYWNKQKLAAAVELLPVMRCAASSPTGCVLSGAGCLLSRDVAEYVFKNQHRWNDEAPSDMALSILVREIIPEENFTPLTRVDYTSGIADVNIDDLHRHYHFRCKVCYNDGIRLDATPKDRSADLAVMARIHELLQAL